MLEAIVVRVDATSVMKSDVFASRAKKNVALIVIFVSLSNEFSPKVLTVRFNSTLKQANDRTAQPETQLVQEAGSIAKTMNVASSAKKRLQLK